MTVTRTLTGPLCSAAVVVVLLGMSLPADAAYPRPGTTERVSVASDGSEAKPLDDTFHQTSISSDGRFVAFASDAPNLVAVDVNLLSDVFVHDRKTHETEIVSITSDGGPALGVGTETFLPTVLSWAPHMTPNGRYVTFASFATNLVPGDTNLTSDIFVYDRKTSRTTLASIATDGSRTNDRSFAPAISGNGRFVTFQSEATTLAEDKDDGLDVYRHDLKTGKTEWVSVYQQLAPTSSPVGAAFGSIGKLASFCGSMDHSGRFVSFLSQQENLVANDGNLAMDTFVRDMDKQVTERVSVQTGGNVGPDDLIQDGGEFDVCGTFAHTDRGGGALSSDGRYVVFRGGPRNLVPSDNNGEFDVFVHDRKTNRTERISVTSTGHDANDPSDGGFITSDGRYVVFMSWASDLQSGDVDQPCLTVELCRRKSNPDIFVHDRQTGATELVSVALDGTTADPPDDGDPTTMHPLLWGARSPSISDDGRFVAFFSDTSDLIEGDTNTHLTGGGMGDVFVRDRGLSVSTGGFTNLRSVPASGDGGFVDTGITSELDSVSDVSDVLTERGANLYGTSLAYRPQYDDLFARIQLEDMPYATGTSLAGDPAILYGFGLTANGVRYEVRVQQIALDSTAGLDPIQVTNGGASFGLFRCDSNGALCAQVETLEGGYGTTGVEVVFALPLSSIGLEAGDEINVSGLEAFTALGSYDLGAVKTLDTLTLPS